MSDHTPGITLPPTTLSGESIFQSGSAHPTQQPCSAELLSGIHPPKFVVGKDGHDFPYVMHPFAAQSPEEHSSHHQSKPDVQFRACAEIHNELLATSSNKYGAMIH
jgi:hypothetical protein